jgi:Caspase domain/Domain of unknown function (DUF4384)
MRTVNALVRSFKQTNDTKVRLFMRALRIPFITLVLFTFGAAHAANHALIMGISGYVRSPLAGVVTDIANARKMALSMNVPETNIITKRDGELTVSGIDRAIEELSSRVKPGDRVFIYFSGHGANWEGYGGQCEQALVTQDMQRYRKEVFQKKIKPIVDRSAKTFVFLDTCHSGGVIEGFKGGTRESSEDTSPIRFKYVDLKGTAGNCQISNQASKGTRDFGVEEAASTSNYYFLAAVAPSEVAIDGGAGVGSWATTSFNQCLADGRSADANGDGVVTLAEARDCAQQRVNRLVAQGSSVTSHTLTAGSGPGADAMPVAFGAVASDDSTSGARINSTELFATIQRNANPNHKVEVRSGKAAFKIKQDYLDLQVTSTKAGYLTLFSVGSSGRMFQLFPNELDRNNQLTANSVLRLPRPEWRLPSNGPAGTNRFLAIVSGTSEPFAGLGVPVAGRFKALDGFAGNAKDLVERLISPTAGCNPASTRDFVPEVSACSADYGAAIIDVREVD